MRNTIDVIPDPLLKGIEAQFGDIGYQEGIVIKISQQKGLVYVVYSNNSRANSNKCYLSARLCECNKIQEATANISVVNNIISHSRNAKVFVSKLDWQIINNQSHKLQTQFLNQINLIWPGAIIPLFYDDKNCVQLRIQCQQLCYVGQNTEIQILIDEKLQPVQNQDPILNKTIFKKIDKLNNFHFVSFGNINTIKLSTVLYKQLNLNDQSVLFLKYGFESNFTVPIDTSQVGIKEQLEYIKSLGIPEKRMEKNKFPLIIMKQDDIQQISVNQCARVFWKFLASGCSLQANNDLKSKTHKKLQFLLNSIKNFRIVLQITSDTDSSRYYQEIKSIFCRTILSSLDANNGKFLVYQKIPFVFSDNLIGYIKLFQDTAQMQDPFIISKSEQSEILRKKLLDCIYIENIYYKQAENSMKQKCEMLLKLNRQLVFNKPVDKKFKELYILNYEKEIAQIQKSLLSNSDQHILVASFNNNGKTILHNILRDRDIKILYVDASQFHDSSLTIGDINIYLQITFQRYEGKFVFIDNIDKVCYQIDAGDLHLQQQRIASKMVLRKIFSCCKIYRKKCIFTAKNQGNMQSQFKNYILIILKNPSLDNRFKVLHSFSEFSNQKIQQIAKNSESMSFGEFTKFILKGIKSESYNNVLTPKFTFSKLAGVKDAKKTIKNVIEKPLKYSFLFKNLSVKLSRGILLYGSSGTGKTAVGQAIADEFQMKFFTVKGSDILSKYIGGSEAAVREVFEKAMAVSPSIVFFDQFQTIVPRRNSSNTGVTDRIVNQFLCYLDGVASVQGVFIVASSSRPQLIDPALLRPGRIDSHIFLDYPQDQERKQLFELYRNSISFNFDIDKAVQNTEGFSYSDLVGLIKELRIKKSAFLLKKVSNIKSRQFKQISEEFFMDIIRQYNTSVNKQEQKRQKKEFQFFKSGGVPDISKQRAILQ